jgi:peptidyl-prolyl cis-trans isomerase SurA
LQVESAFPVRARTAALVVLSAAVLIAAAGCGHSLSPDVVATVNKKEILGAELDRQYAIYKTRQGAIPQAQSAEQVDILKLDILRSMIEEEILQQRAARFNLTASDEDVNAELTKMKAPFFSEDEFDRQLKQHNQTLDDLKRDISRQLTQGKLLNKEIESKINITDAQISDYYNSHKTLFNLIEPRYNIARIVVSAAPSPQTTNLQNNKASSDADAKKKIEALHAKLDSGEEFGSLAANYSEDKDSASNGGDMGFVPDSQLRGAPDVYNAINQLKPGQFTGILPMVDPASHRIIGYSIYRLISKEAAGQRELSDPRVKQAIHQSLHDDQKQLLQKAYIEVLDDDAKVHNYLADRILKDGAK